MKYNHYILSIMMSLFILSACEIGVDTGITDEMIDSILGIECTIDADCDAEPFVCVENRCRLFCSDAYPCPENQWCNYKTSSCLTSLEGYIGEPCREEKDCPSGTICHLMEGGMRCTLSCASKAECESYFEGGCCSEIEGQYICQNKPSCELIAREDGDVEQDTVDEEKCQTDAYRCLNTETVQRCNGDFKWTTHRMCQGKQYCYKGECVSGDMGGCEEQYHCCPGTYRCRGVSEVQKCDSKGENWLFYKDCDDLSICSGGECEKIEDTDGDEDLEVEAEVIDNSCTDDSKCSGEDQYCFSPQGEEGEGNCRVYCDYPDGSCPGGYKCIESKCVAIEGYCEIDTDCGMSEFCDKLIGESSGVCTIYCDEMGQMCPENTYCDEDSYSINYGKCVSDGCETCSYDDQCSGQADKNYICNIPLGQVSGCCVEHCYTAPCYGGLKCCPDGRCGMYCEDDDICGNCPEECSCDPLYGGCVCDGCPSCPEGYYCDDSTSPNCVPVGSCENPPVCSPIMMVCCFGYTCNTYLYGTYGFCI